MESKNILVTGGTGFVAIHTIIQLVQQGYHVKTTLRSLSRSNIITNALQEAGVSDPERVSFYEADLNDDAGWDEAAEGCEYVLHIASPFPAESPKDENEVIAPARNGALRALKAAGKAGVKRVVLTSSFAAVGYSIDPKGHIYTESDWTAVDHPNAPYIKSKAIAERAAWDYVEREAKDLELTVINPVGIFGPVIGGIVSASLNTVVKGIMDGIVKETPPFTFGVVDVRDVADIHIKAMLDPAAGGERFIATSQRAMSFFDVAQLIRKERPQLASRIADLRPVAEDLYVTISNEKAVSRLGWQPRMKEEAILASVDSLKGNLLL